MPMPALALRPGRSRQRWSSWGGPGPAWLFLQGPPALAHGDPMNREHAHEKNLHKKKERMKPCRPTARGFEALRNYFIAGAHVSTPVTKSCRLAFSARKSNYLTPLPNVACRALGS